MHKRLVAMLLVGTVAITGLFGLSACGPKIQKGDRVVNEEAWKDAFENTFKLTNYTLEGSITASTKVNGTVAKQNNNDSVTYVSHNFTNKGSSSYIAYYDEYSNEYYGEASRSAETKGFVSGDEQQTSSKEVRKESYTLSEKKEDNTTYWRTRYSKSEVEDLTKKKSEENYWEAVETSSFVSSSYVSSDLNILLNAVFYKTESETPSERLSTLYDSFIYENGYYTSTLYSSLSLKGGVNTRVQCSVVLSFKGGYVIGYKVKIDAKDTIEKKDAYSVEYTHKEETVIALSDINCTEVSKKSNKDITKAIEKAKIEKAKNNKN